MLPPIPHHWRSSLPVFTCAKGRANALAEPQGIVGVVTTYSSIQQMFMELLCVPSTGFSLGRSAGKIQM